GNLSYDGLFYKTYDAEGRLVKDSSSPSNVLTYQYDAFNRRVQKNLNGILYKYTYSGISQIEERNGATNSLLSHTVFSDFLSPVLIEKNSNTYYYHQNELNSVEAITNSSGSLTERYQYDVYGKATIYDGSNNIISSSIAGNHFAYTGQEYDSANGNYRFHYRNYSPATGTFDQRDLIGYGDGTGMYQYVHDNPANGIDIFGLKDCPPESKGSTDAVAIVFEITGQTSNLTSILEVLQRSGITNLGGLTKLSTLGELTQSLSNSDLLKTVNGSGVNGFLLPLNALGAVTSALDLHDNFNTNSYAKNTENVLGLVSGTASTGVGVAGLGGAAAQGTLELAAAGGGGALLLFAGAGTAGGLAGAGAVNLLWKGFTHFTDAGSQSLSETAEQGEGFMADYIKNRA
ncbi:MAG TPA: RHS repeat-associated core domain-containing protein, partial [Ferruginibacter sp.]|nr:RHS repeat-associated core domain-containing protein [Ferruginibacter sp.]